MQMRTPYADAGSGVVLSPPRRPSAPLRCSPSAVIEVSEWLRVCPPGAPLWLGCRRRGMYVRAHPSRRRFVLTFAQRTCPSLSPPSYFLRSATATPNAYPTR